MRRDPFDALIQDASVELDAQVRGEQRRLAPDFAAIVEEARARDPGKVSEAAVAEARGLEPAVELREPSMRLVGRAEEEFAALLAEARAEIEADVARMRAAGPPPFAVPEARSSGRRWGTWLAAAAAVAALAFGLRPLLMRGEATPSGIQAPWQDQAEAPRGEVEPTPAPIERRVIERPVEEVEPAVVMPEAVPEVVPPAEEKVAPETDPGERVVKAAKAAKTAKREGLADRLRALDEEAEALWQAGDLAGAEARYKEIVGLAPGARAADLAYGDLFSLARLRHGEDREVALWSEYLKVFPRGRYAEDARAGLCRRAEGEDRTTCWRAYLTDFPAGVHQRQAQRVLGESE